MSQHIENIPAISSPTIIAEDIPCATCGYNLRTRTTNDICPECGSPVAPSIKVCRDSTLALSRPRLIATGLTIVAVAFALQITSPILDEFDVHAPILEISRLAFILSLPAGILTTAYATCRPAASRWLKVWVTLASLGFVVGSSFEPVLQLKTWHAGGMIGEPMFSAKFHYIARDFGTFSLSLLFIGFTIQLLRLSKSLRNKLRVSTWIICCPIIVGYLAMLAYSMTREIAFENRIAEVRIERVMNVFTLFELTSAIAWPAMAILMLLYRREILRRAKTVQLKLV